MTAVQAKAISVRDLANKMTEDLLERGERPESQSLAISTSRSKGAVGANPLVYRKFRELMEADPSLREATILDFGAGKDAKHAHALKEDGCVNIQAFDFPENSNTELHLGSLEDPFDVVLVSNVLNVLRGDVMLHNTLEQIEAAVAPHGLLVCNFPTEPRHHKRLTNAKLLDALRQSFDLFNIKGPQNGKGALVIVGRKE